MPTTKNFILTNLIPAGWPFPTHDWLKTVDFSYEPGYTNPVIDKFAKELGETMREHGHRYSVKPHDATSLILTTAPYGKALNWREAMMFTARKAYNLPNTPTIFTIIHATHRQFRDSLVRLSQALQGDQPDPSAFAFPGLTDKAFRTLFEQGLRGGPIMSLARLLQSQSKSIRIILLVGDRTADFAYLFDLVGAHPRIDAGDTAYFYNDIMLRLITAMSTTEITAHRIEHPPIPRQVWDQMDAPKHMQAAAAALGQRKFFTEMVMISNLVHVPSIGISVANQYSEGCFATWAPEVDGLVATVTGSARPVEKDAITEDDLAVIVGVRDDGSGAVVRHVEDKQNDSPSSESVEMMEMDAHLPRIRLDAGWGISKPVPVVRSKLHGHRGVASFDPAQVEFVQLEQAYYFYPVSCATEAQANAIVNAFATSQALQNPSDQRQVVFTILPGHGLMLAEKWVAGKSAFEHIYNLMDSGALNISSEIPQGPFSYVPKASGMMEISS